MASPPRRFEPSLRISQDATLPRRALAQKSNSQINSGNTPSIRLIPESGSDVYDKSPFPQLPSQILAPRYAPGSLFDKRQGRNVNDENYSILSSTPPNARAPPASVTLVPKALQLRKPARISASTIEISDHDSGIDISPLPSSTRLSHPPTPSTAPTSIHSDGRESALSGRLLPSLLEDPLSEDDNELDYSQSSQARLSTIRIVHPAAVDFERPVTASQLNSSPPSSPHGNDLTPRQQANPSSRSPPNYVVLDASSPPQSISTPESIPRRVRKRPAIYESVESLVFSDTSASDRPKTSKSQSGSSTNVAAIVAALEKGTQIQYPVVKPATVSSSWAEVTRPPVQAEIAPSMSEDYEDDYRSPPWSSRLSTIASESERATVDTRSERPGHSRQPSERQAVIQTPSSEDETAGHSSISASPIAYPAPLFTRGGQPQTVYEGRTSEEEGEDTLGELQPPPLRSQRSGFFRPFSKSRPSSSESLRSQASGISFMGDLSWARRYYSGTVVPPLPNTSVTELTGHSSSGDSRLNTADSRYYTTSSSRLDSATTGPSGSPLSETFPADIYRPRNRADPAARNDGTFLISSESSDSLAVHSSPEVRPERRPEVQQPPPVRAKIRHVQQSPQPQRAWTRPRSQRSQQSQARPRSHRSRRSQTRAPTTATSVLPPPTLRNLNGSNRLYSPHLTRDRRQDYDAWRAPSFDDDSYSELFFGSVNRQIWLFVVGFAFPLAWFLAAFLPIPKSAQAYEQETAEVSRVGTATTTASTARASTTRTSTTRPHRASGAAQSRHLQQVYLSNPSLESMADIDEKRYQKAKWWRILNRIMILPGCMIVAAIVALAVVASRSHLG